MILLSPDPRLHEKSRPVHEDEFGVELDTVMNAMISALQKERGAGLAGVQVGDVRRILIVNLGPDKTPEKVVNPVLVQASKLRCMDKEGCLSFPGLLKQVPRSRQVTVQYQTPFGETRTRSLSGFEARCIQHEIDHLNGKTIF